MSDDEFTTFFYSFSYNGICHIKAGKNGSDIGFGVSDK
jgi:hypothetical protein